MSTPDLTAKPSFWQSKNGRLIRRLFRSLALIYILVCVVMYLLQTKLIFRGHVTQGSPDAQIRPDPDQQLVDLKAADGTSIKGLFCSATPARILRPDLAPESAPSQSHPAPRPVVLFFYGNAMCMADATEEADLFNRLGCHCMLVDYEGYGLSGGAPSEKGCYAAAEAAYHYVLTRPDVARGKIIVAGWSLGGGVAVDLTFNHRGDATIAGLMTFCTFSSVVDYAHDQFPFLPASLLVKHRFLSTDKLKHLSLPYFAAHGTKDSVVPFRNLDRVTAAYAGSPHDLTRLETNSDHNDFFSASGQPLKDAITRFLDRVVR